MKPLIASTIVIHLGSAGHVRSHCKVTERLRVLLRIMAATLSWSTLSLTVPVLTGSALIVVLVVIVFIPIP